MKNFTDKETERFTSKYKKVGECWLWQAPLDKDGYGSFFFRGAIRRAHRVAYFGTNGEIPEGNVVNHVCRVRNCVNPQHLQCITHEENSMKDSTSKGYINSQKTACPQGHPYDKVVVYGGRTQRICSICDKAARAKRKRETAKAAKESLKV